MQSGALTAGIVAVIRGAVIALRGRGVRGIARQTASAYGEYLMTVRCLLRLWSMRASS